MRKFGFLGLAILLAVVWVLSWLVFKVTSGLIHLLLLFALASAVLHLFGRRSSA